jgi:hypothetical protein
MADDKKEIEPALISPQHSNQVGEVTAADDDFEVFKQTTDGVQFRLVGWIKASVIFLKSEYLHLHSRVTLVETASDQSAVIFATGVLSIPTAMYSLGVVGGTLSVIGWGALNTYFAIVQGNFRNSHAHCHSIADMAYVVGGPIAREICGFLFIVAYVLCSGSGIVGLSVGFNALSEHAACTVWWAFLAFVLVVASASVRKFEKIGWL